jgi:hypothetical protein
MKVKQHGQVKSRKIGNRKIEQGLALFCCKQRKQSCFFALLVLLFLLKLAHDFLLGQDHRFMELEFTSYVLPSGQSNWFPVGIQLDGLAGVRLYILIIRIISKMKVRS